MIKNHGRIEKYNHISIGRNSRLDTMQAAILNVKLGHLDNWIKRRRIIADLYYENLSNVGDIILFKPNEFQFSVYHLFVVRTKHRNELMNFLNQNKIETGIHYPIALPELKAYCDVIENFESQNAISFSNEILSLPIGEHLEESDIIKICDTIKDFYGKR